MLHYPGGWTYDKGQIYGLILCVILPEPFFGSGDPFKWSTIHISQKILLNSSQRYYKYHYDEGVTLVYNITRKKHPSIPPFK